MTVARVSQGVAYGSVRAPPSKSYTHRALVVAHLAHRDFRVHNPLESNDTRATATAVGRLGTPVARRPGTWTVRPVRRAVSRERIQLSCGESGTTLRFASALAALSPQPVILSGTGRLADRPIDELLAALRQLGANCGHVYRTGLPIRVLGPIQGGRVSLDASQSSQFTSALLLVLPTLERESVIRLTGEVVSQPYVEATLAVLAHHGIRFERTRSGFQIPGRQRFRGSAFSVPGDASSAAYLWASGVVTGGEVRVCDLSLAWPQADLASLDLFAANGALVVRREDGAVVRGGTRRPFQVDLTDAPDLYPLAGVLAATTPGVSQISGAHHVVLKESNRRAETARLARALGGKVSESGDGLRIEGTNRVRPLHRTEFRDHRMVMSAAVGALAAQGDSEIGDAVAVRKSFPGFWEAFRSVTGDGNS